jgi:hypothetical protein
MHMLAAILTSIIAITTADSSNQSEVWNITWPFVSAEDSGLRIGYGDWCPDPLEGPHPGLDFTPPDWQLDWIHSPATTDVVVLDFIEAPETGSEQFILLGLEESDEWGWYYGHLNVSAFYHTVGQTIPVSLSQNQDHPEV